MIDGWSISCKIVLKWMPMDLTDGKSTLVQVMAWCRQATSHYLSQCWPRSLSPYGVIRPQWVNTLLILFAFCEVNLPIAVDQQSGSLIFRSCFPEQAFEHMIEFSVIWDVIIPMWVRCYDSSLQWLHNGHDGVSNHQRLDCLPNHLFRLRSNKIPKLRAIGLFEGNSPVTDEFPPQRASKAENISIWCRHHI